MGRKTNAGAEQGRRERAAAVLDKGKTANLRRSQAFWLTVALVFALITGAVVKGVNDANDKRDLSDLGAVKTFDVKSDHVTNPITYPQTPPAGGPHNPIWLNCGVYETPVPNENAVHSMEHGAVWVTYRPDLPESDVATLKATMPDTYGVLSPYDGLPAPIVASAWGKQLQLKSADDPRLAKFITAYQLGKNAPEPGASCTGASDGTLPLDYADRG